MTKKNDHFDILDLLKRFFQWSHYKGGIPLVFIMFGFALIGLFALFSYWFGYNWIVLGLGICSIVTGLFLKYFDDKKNNK
ncbi:MAG: hypothetical protein WCJ84_04430 [Candidatus Peregrinibacteria bacterium]